MQTYTSHIEKFLGTPNTVFVVPVYQRNYDWQSENCKQLFNDILRIVSSGQEHFLGTVCYKTDNSRTRSIIDGQQRLTSITLMLKAIYDFDTEENYRAEIQNQYMYNQGHVMNTDYLKYKLHLNKRDDAVYHILLNTDREQFDSFLTKAQQNSRVYQNYLLFYNLISEFVENGGFYREDSGSFGSFDNNRTRNSTRKPTRNIRKSEFNWNGPDKR